MDVLIPVVVGTIAIAAVATVWRLLAPGEPSHGSSAEPASTLPDERITMYDRVGPALIRTAVDQFYHRMLGDPRLAPYFAGVDLSRLRRHQALFLGQILGGPAHFQTHQLEALHRRLHIGADTYWAAGGHLIAIFSALKAPRDVLQRIFEVLLDLEPLVVGGDTIPSTCLRLRGQRNL